MADKYYDFVLQKVSNQVFLQKIGGMMERLDKLESILPQIGDLVEKYGGVKKEFMEHIENLNIQVRENETNILLNNSYESIIENISKLEQKIGILKEADIPTADLVTQIENHISYCNKEMTISDIIPAIDMCDTYMQEIAKEKEKIEQGRRQWEAVLLGKKQERNRKIAKYVGIGIAIIVGLWLLIAFVIPFVIQWWWAILIVVVVIGYFIMKD